MLYSSAIIVLSLADKVVKVQSQKFVCSSYPVPGTLHLVLEVGFSKTPAGHWSSKVAIKILEDLTRDELQEKTSHLVLVNQWKQGRTPATPHKCLEKEGLDPATYTFEVRGNQLTIDPLAQISANGAEHIQCQT